MQWRTRWYLCCLWLSQRASSPCRTPWSPRATSRPWPRCVTSLTESWWSTSAGPNTSLVWFRLNPPVSLTRMFSHTSGHTHIRSTKSLIRSHNGLLWLVVAKTAQRGEGRSGLAVCYLSVFVFVCVWECVYCKLRAMPSLTEVCSHTNQMTSSHMEVLICFLGLSRLPVQSDLLKSSWLLERTELISCHRTSWRNVQMHGDCA